LLLKKVKESQHYSQKKPKILITTWPFMANLVGSFGELLSIYYRVDDYSEFPGVRRETMGRLEKELIGKVDMVISGAVRDIDIPGKPTYYLPHGVDFDHSQKWRMIPTGELQSNRFISLEWVLYFTQFVD
jgi:hypothetical protein